MRPGKSHSVFGDSVINDLADPHGYGSGSPERKQRRQQRFNDHVDLLRGHLTQAPLRVDQARAQSRRAADILYDGFAALVIFLDAATHTLGIAPDRFNIFGRCRVTVNVNSHLNLSSREISKCQTLAKKAK